ncbi:1,4-dihydroxy-2-naphthoate polyprenyltransferase [Aestuariimicrobium sp. Y1814]|uniref:1,4-dihydroxy-2-naphthoate polyprenyltransferase n=1 Tax=Aestuariimicrobium sp. Y1814 TaxID=3418742 RepID=UPI003DA78E26
MATRQQWVEGARPRTLPAATAPVMAGIATAWHLLGELGGRHLLLAVLAAVVALALQVGVNYANDYSDGIRGTDDDRVGPMRLVGSKAATPQAVKRAAFTCFGVAAVAGLVIVLITQAWWLLAVGVACVLAAWFYTGGKNPYGYLGLGEVFVFIFFGLVAVCGTHYILTGGLTAEAVVAAVGIGAVACALLVANNLRDIPTDIEAGKKTLATRLGEVGTRRFYVALMVVAMLSVVVVAALTSWWALLGLLMVPTSVQAVQVVTSGATGHGLVPVLKTTGVSELRMGLGLLAGIALSSLF